MSFIILGKLRREETPVI